MYLTALLFGAYRFSMWLWICAQEKPSVTHTVRCCRLKTGSRCIYHEAYTENNPVEKNTVAGKAAKAKEKELEEWLRGLDGMDRLVEDYVGDKIPLWEKIMDRQGTVCCAWEKIAFEEGLKVGIRLMMEAYSL